MRTIPVVMAGGRGTRLWPLSRKLYPKQFLPLAGTGSMLQETFAFAAVAAPGEAPLVICGEDHRFLVAQQALEAGRAIDRIVLEPDGRGTAPAVAIAALLAAERDPDALILVMPADHVIADRDAFAAAVAASAPAAAAGRLVTFGIVPSRADTGYGYIRPGEALAGVEPVRAIARFIEKPDADTAARLVDEGCLWNAGIFLFGAGAVLDELDRHSPATVAACRAAIERATVDLDFLRLDPESFAAAPAEAIDRAVMEKTDRGAVAAGPSGWSDVGSWASLWALSPQDADGNVVAGPACLIEARNAYVRSDGAVVGLLGLDDVVVVATEDAVLVAAKDRVQDVGRLVERLEAEGRPEATLHRRVHRPWGFYQTVHAGERFQVKRITVNPGQTLSLQKHFHRAEHWVVVNGTALVTRDGEEVMLHENESVYLPLGCVHRLANPGKIPLNLIEVQSGPYLGEDDIVRLEDVYGRG